MITFDGGTIEIKKVKGVIVMAIMHPYRFGEVIKLTPEQARLVGETLTRLSGGGGEKRQ
jgi:hypothetical protein